MSRSFILACSIVLASCHAPKAQATDPSAHRNRWADFEWRNSETATQHDRRILRLIPNSNSSDLVHIESLRQCYYDFKRRDGRIEAKRDARSGKSTFIVVQASGYKVQFFAPGIECKLREPMISRRLEDNRFIQKSRGGDVQFFETDGLCQRAERYFASNYNIVLAEEDKGVIRRSCVNSKGAVSVAEGAPTASPDCLREAGDDCKANKF